MVRVFGRGSIGSERQKAMSEMTTSKPQGIRQLVNSDTYKAEFERLLGSQQMADRFVRVALTAFTRTPDLLKCEPASVFRCLMDAAGMRLEADGRVAHLIPRRDNKKGTMECTLIIDYKGLVELAYRSGKVRSIHCDVIYQGDVFTYSLGRVVEHTPWWLRTDDKPADRGQCIGAYGIVELVGDAVKCEVMSEQEIQGIRNRSMAAGRGPWVTDTDEMRKKTVFRRISKWLPLSVEIIEAYERDGDQLPAIVHQRKPSRIKLEDLQQRTYVDEVADVLDAEPVTEE
jgi:recombination protein RecT